MINRRVRVKALKRGLLAALLVLAVTSVSHAGPLGVNFDAYPDITAQFITSTYSATTGAFAANGWAMTVTKDGTTKSLSPSEHFQLTATIGTNGVATAGQLIVGSLTDPSLSLLRTYNLLSFAFDATKGGALEFLFGPAVGTYVPGTFSSTAPIDVLLMPGSGFTGNFATWTSAATSGTAEVREAGDIGSPEPSALLLMLGGGGLAALFLASRRRSTAVLTHC
jgi:hypothetical protein